MQSYTLEQLRQLTLLAFREDWAKAFIYVGYELGDANIMARYAVKHNIIGLIKEYCFDCNELRDRIDFAISYLINEFNI